ncbi:YsnF/AvaK domain-containing protein [Salipaludibacillus daqingensis]|uniref:YsnF/AvaK domain-containing protein n=1 Tax=Salipaludibacillus daqingensis TaxID=3041001 RepID=UPI0024751369|nr:YsnF/AvaK domain-containing protein [Salipaludibacillus daqingensis]
MVKYVVTGAIIGYIIAWILNVPVSGGLVLGAAVGGMSYTFQLNRKSSREETLESDDDKKMQLKEEQLHVRKNRVQTNEVDIRKDVIEEQKTFSIPVRREEMVIESGDEEEFRIPLKEEQIEINKEPVKINDVSVSKRQKNEVEQVTDTLKKEKAAIKTDGKVDIQEHK